jgi:hypothetical protein
MNKALLIPLLGLIALYCDCVIPPLAGGSSQQGNGVVAGYIVSANGLPATAAKIRIRPTTYVQTPGAATDVNAGFDAITDMTGHFSVSGIHPGSYTIEANDKASSAALISTTIEEQNSTADVGMIGLKPYARIFGVVDAAATVSYPQRYVQVQGLERLARVGQDGSFAFADLPEGCFDLNIVAADSTTAPVELFGINAASDATASVVIPAGWRYVRRFRLNTTASGADVAGNVTNFPVLVRLTAGNFDFSQARNDGADIRFTKSDNSFLPCESERWDPVTGLAEVWVKADTVYGNDSTQYLTMYWGNVGAVLPTNSKAVFDTASGFAGVWHLGENGDSIYDATGNAFNGKKTGSNPAPGMIGNAEYFANGNYIKIPGLLNRPSNITLSAWVRSDTTAGRGQDIVSLGDAVLIRFDDVKGLGTGGSYHNNPVVNDSMYGRVSSGYYLAKTGWHYLAFSINTATHVQTLYIDGVKSVNTQDVNPIYYAGLGTDTYIGIHGNGKTGFNFIGQIDEVRVNSISVASDWVKLCFMNQKARDALVRW